MSCSTYPDGAQVSPGFIDVNFHGFILIHFLAVFCLSNRLHSYERTIVEFLDASPSHFCAYGEGAVAPDRSMRWEEGHKVRE